MLLAAPQEANEVRVGAQVHILQLVEEFVVTLTLVSYLVEHLLSLNTCWGAFKTRNLLI